ncbi:MAG TPA: GEVED domain-containing protein [Saprospiraceae bacterium]|nr:GEVED domain-containing protein [Saprospiraceae bacterium]
MIRLTVTLLALFIWGITFGQKAIATEVDKIKTQGHQFKEVSLFKYQTNDLHDRAVNVSGLTKGTILSIDQEMIHALVSNKTDFIQLSIPVSDRAGLKLNLYKHDIFTSDFALYASSNPTVPVDYTPGVYYRGVIDGDPHSVVAISVFNDEVMGLISNEAGNMVLGPIEHDRENAHILYNDANLQKKTDFICSTPDEGPAYTEEDLEVQPQGRDAGDCVRIYIEIDDDIVTAKGGATNATNYITALFNQSFILYANEQVTLTISQILAWTTNSPYTGSTASAMFTSFQNNSGDFNGNVAQLVSYAASGGIASLDAVCQTNADWRKGFSSIDGVYSNVPTYSWDVMVITHEMGHTIGSKHTHACAWNGNNTAIDGCAGAVEGSCPLPGNPPGGGTIMSYCHLTQVGINLSLGFGPQPGNVLRNRVNAANNCLTSCGPPPPPPPPAYCSSNGTSSAYEYIKKVVLGTINNLSNNNQGYGNFIAMSTTLNPGSSNSINLTPGFASGSFTEFWRVWIDYNNDLDWADAGEQVGQGSGSAAINVTFTVPAGTPIGSKRMRVSMSYGAYPPICGSFTYGEVEDYTVIIGSAPPPVPSCTDGIQNQGETGIDCGGPCAPCPGTPTCSDGIKNQGETGIDCGGPCKPCGSVPTCNDGIQNQGETGIDCGGPCAPCPPPPGGTTILHSGYFETGWDGWQDGGSDAARVISNNSWEGSWSIQLRDNSGTQSAMTSPSFNLNTAVGLQISFHFKAFSMETGEDFWLQYKSGSGSWVTIGYFIAGTNFSNNIFYVTTVTVPNFVPTSSGTFRIQADAGDDNDQVFIDAVIITRFNGSGLIEPGMQIEEIEGQSVAPWNNLPEDTNKSLSVYPNPVQDVLNITFNGEIQAIRVVSLEGKEVRIGDMSDGKRMIDISHLSPGIYFLSVQSDGEWYPTKFSKM